MIKTAVEKDYMTLLLPEDYRYLGTSVLGNGSGKARRILNLKVHENKESDGGNQGQFDSPESALSGFIMKQGWKEKTIGFMTAASMKSYRKSVKSRNEFSVEVHLTSGLSNARASGDPADCSELFIDAHSSFPPGTINMIIIVNLNLSFQAALELLMISSAAKASVLFSNGIKSVKTGRPAVGTGTDSTVILFPENNDWDLIFAGTHTIPGELTALAVEESLASSINFYK